MPAGNRDPVGALVSLLAAGERNRTAFRSLTDEFEVGRDEWFRKNVLDLVLGFIEHVLNGGSPAHPDIQAIEELKAFVDIREGEFIQQRPVEISAILTQHLEAILDDLTIDSREDLQQVELQSVFDVSYDQYLALTRRPIESAMETLQQQLRYATENRDRLLMADSEMKLRALEPLFLLAVAQPRTLGGRY